MSKVVKLDWDSKILGIKVGKIYNFKNKIYQKDLIEFDFVFVQVPQNNIECINNFLNLGFIYISTDLTLECSVKSPINKKNESIFEIRKSLPALNLEVFKLSIVD